MNQALAAFPHDSLAQAWRLGEYHTGAMEPWSQNVLAALLAAIGGHDVLEVGTYLGHTSAVLCLTLETLGGGEFLGAEIDPERRTRTLQRLRALSLPRVVVNVSPQPGIELLKAQATESFDLVFLDGDHTRAVVEMEADEATRVLRSGGLLCGHDVYGVFDLAGVWTSRGGIALRVPLIHAAGGLGIWQKP